MRSTRVGRFRVLIATILWTALSTDFSTGASATRAAGLTELERQRLVAHLEMTSAWLSDEVSTLTPAQLAFKPAPSAWSILQVVDHLVVVAPIYWDDLQKAVKAGRRNRASTTTDADMLWYGIDRANRETAIAAEVPRGQVSDSVAAMAAYRKYHARLLQYVKTTSDDLRGSYVDRQGCDGYQWALLISSHEQRHILQIREIKAAAGFPKQ